MRMDIVAGSGKDEFYTPEYAITPLTKYLKPNSVVWCPFDTCESNFVKVLGSLGHTVIGTHLEQGYDFFSTNIPCDYIISNPPYSMKAKVFERLFGIGRPFAMLVGLVGLFESQERFQLFKNNAFEIMYFNRRVSYFENYADQRPSLNPPFSSVYLTHKVLPAPMVFEEIDRTTVLS
jgi:hypothetical protein